jgi:hypothetical protein
MGGHLYDLSAGREKRQRHSDVIVSGICVVSMSGIESFELAR